VAAIGELASWPVKTVETTSSVGDAARLMRDDNIGDVVVVDGDGRVVGMLTDRDLALRVLAEELGPAASVEGVYTRDPVTISAGADAKEAEQLMREKVIHRLPIVDRHGRPTGIVSLEDLAASGYVDRESMVDTHRVIAEAYRARATRVAHAP
jgi:CBS domain-containing protein